MVHQLSRWLAEKTNAIIEIGTGDPATWNLQTFGAARVGTGALSANGPTPNSRTLPPAAPVGR